jgi:type II secretory pathway predicted ATPase ExeA
MDLKKLQALYGLKWNPFAPEVPTEGLLVTPSIDNFCFRVETLALDGGFALIAGIPGTGKSSTFRMLSERLGKIPDVVVAEFERPQGGVTDFYRELGSLFGIPLTGSNRWGGFKTLRAKFKGHIETTLLRPVILIDEAQLISDAVLEELRILSSTRFDSCILLTVVLGGDTRLLERLERSPDLKPLESRLRIRRVLGPQSHDELLAILQHSLAAAGNRALLTDELCRTLVEHAAGNLRTMMLSAQEVLAAGVAKNAKRLDEALYLEVTGAELMRPRAKIAKPARR